MEMLITLEDLRIYLEKKYEEVDFDQNNPSEFITYFDKFLNSYILTKDEYDYVMPISSTQEDQVNDKTMINSKKAQQILLKIKNK